MTIQELHSQVLRLSASDRWQLMRMLLESLQPTTEQKAQKRGNLSRLRGIAKPQSGTMAESDDYASYLTEKYQ